MKLNLARHLTIDIWSIRVFLFCLAWLATALLLEMLSIFPSEMYIAISSAVVAGFVSVKFSKRFNCFIHHFFGLYF